MKKLMAGAFAAAIVATTLVAPAASLRDRILFDVAQSFARTGSLVSEVTLVVASADESRLPKATRPLISSVLKKSAERLEGTMPKAAGASNLLHDYTKSVREDGFDEVKHGTSWTTAVGELRASAEQVDTNVRNVTENKMLSSLLRSAAKPAPAPSASESVGRLEGTEPPRQESELAAVDRVAGEMQGLQKQVGLLASALADKWRQLSRTEGQVK